MNNVTVVMRPLSTLALERAPGQRLAMIRTERERARSIARQHLHAQPRLYEVKASIQAGYPILNLSFTFTDDVGQHHYRKVGRCMNCPRRWGEHSRWEKAKDGAS